MAPQLDYLYAERKFTCEFPVYYYEKNSQTSDMLRSLSGQEGDDHVAESSDSNSGSEIFNEQNLPSDEKTTPNQARRGRPSSSTVNELMKSGLKSDSKYKCKYCSRSFPRAKSLQTHLRIHDGLKPFKCTFPGCSKTFVQSGQRKTHLRLHAGDKPFICTFQGCNARYTHPNRRCKGHPNIELKRVEMQLKDIAVHYEDLEQSEWVRSYYEDRLPVSAESLSSSDMDDNTAEGISPKPHSSTNSNPLKDVIYNNGTPKSSREHNTVVHIQKRLNYFEDSSDKENLTINGGSSVLNVENHTYDSTENHPKKQRVMITYSDASSPNSDVFHNVRALNNIFVERVQNGTPSVQPSKNTAVDPETLEHAKALLSFWVHANTEIPISINPTIL